MKRMRNIKTLYEQTITDGILVEEGKDIFETIDLCTEAGKFIFDIDSSLNFVKSTYKGKQCIRMIFVLQESEAGKVKDVDRVMDLINFLEGTFVYLNDTQIKKKKDYIYLDAIKVLN